MKQISYNILGLLLKKETHIRGIADELKTNQMTVLRKVYGLQKENVLDFKQEGKNKVFFIKKTLEARQYILMVELNKLAEAVKKYPRLRLIAEGIQNNGKIHLAVIFGSYAKFCPDKNSDIDLYIETADSQIKKEVEQIDSKLSVKLGAYDKNNLLIKEIEKNHIIIKGVELYYEKAGLFA